MLPVYEAIDVLDIIEETAGHTRPWVVTARTPQGLRVFIVKMYNPSQVQDSYIITREIASNLIAKEFEFNVPDYALIDIPEDLALSKGMDEQMLYSAADTHLKFGSLRIKNPLGVMHEFPFRVLNKHMDLDTLYAFDNLIRNQDRGQYKVNLLFGEKRIFLIDHELALQSEDIDISRSDILTPDDKFTRYHFAYPYLRKFKGNKKRYLFNNFEEYLRLMNTRKFENLFQELTMLGYPDYSDKIISWINYVKENSTNFVERLKSTLR